MKESEDSPEVLICMAAGRIIGCCTPDAVYLNLFLSKLGSRAKGGHVELARESVR